MGKSIKVVHLQWSSKSSGNPGIRLHDAMLENGLESCIISVHSEVVGDSLIRPLGGKAKWISNVDIKLEGYLTKNKVPEYGKFTYPVLGTDVSKLEAVQEADVIYLHWINFGFLNFKNIEQLAKLGKPVIFFLHDMWTISGGCHYSFDCKKYETGCHNCQIFQGNKVNDLSAREFAKKRTLYSKYDNLYFLAPSTWMYHCAKKSALTREKPVVYIPNILDDRVYKPFDKKTAKRILNIDEKETVISFGAVSVGSPYKGRKYLEEALRILHQQDPEQNITVLIFGSSYNREIADAIPFKTKFMGYLKDEYSATLVYNASDVFLAPSLAETFGYVILEALSCNTPVVAFDTGGISDIIVHQLNGYLAKYKDAYDLAAGIDYCLKNKIRGYKLPIFNYQLTINKHLDLINELKSGN